MQAEVTNQTIRRWQRQTAILQLILQF